MFPNKAVTIAHELVGVSSYDIALGDEFTILGVAMQQSNTSSNTVLKCDDVVIAKNYATNYSHVPMNYRCEGDIEISKTGNDNAFVIVTYVPYFTDEMSTTTLGYNPIDNIASSTDVKIYGSISAGEIVISSILLILLVIFLMKLLSDGLSNVKTKRKYIKYQSADVPIDD